MTTSRSAFTVVATAAAGGLLGAVAALVLPNGDRGDVLSTPPRPTVG